MKIFWRILFFTFFIKPILNFFIGINIFGKENFTKVLGKQVIIIANHNSHLDTLVLMNLFSLKCLSKIRPVAAEDYFTKNKLVKAFVENILNVLLIPRDNFTKSNNPLNIMGKAIEAGYSIIIFPEGSRGKPEELEQFQAGISHLIKKFPNIPVLPIFMKGMGKSLPKGEKVLVPFFCDVMIGEPKYFTGNKQEIMNQIESAIINLREKLKENLGR